MLPKQTGIYKYAIKLVNSKQPFYGLIYSLDSVELKTLKINIKTRLANSFF